MTKLGGLIWNQLRKSGTLGRLRIGREEHSVVFEEHEHAHGRTQCDNNTRAAVSHVIADAAVSVLMIVGLLLARLFGWLWMEPLAGILGACLIASYSFGMVRDTGAILLDMVPDRPVADNLQQTIGGRWRRVFSKPPAGSKFHPAGFLMSIVGAILLVLIAKLIS